MRKNLNKPPVNKPPITKPPVNKPPVKKPSESTVIDQPTQYPWTNGSGPQQINGYYMWANNFINSTPAIQFFPDNVYTKQTLPSSPGKSTDSFINSTSQQYTYTENIYNIPNTDINSVFFFTGFSNAYSSLSTAMTGAITGAGGMYANAIESNNYYFLNTLRLNSTPGSSGALLGLVLGGATVNGGWSPGSNGAIYSCYEAFTTSGTSFTYTETGTGNTLTGTGTGIFGGSVTVSGTVYEYIMNSIVFDIETYGTNGGSTGQDFLNLFTYIKTNENSVVENKGIIIIVTIAHSCSNFNGTGQSVCSTILANQAYDPGTGYSTSNPKYTWDYISPQMYTQNVGTMNEYVANNNIYWTGTNSFTSYLLQNPNISTYGLNLLLPSTYNYGLYTTGGSNQGNPPNNYFYQSSPNNVNPIVESNIEAISIPYSIDTGLLAFFSSIFSTTSYSNLGGCLSWLNGSLSDMPTTAPTTIPSSGAYIWLDEYNNYWGMYTGLIGNGSTGGGSNNNPLYIPIGSAYNTLIVQVYGAGGGGGGGGVNITTSEATAPSGQGGGGGGGSYCCFSISAADPIDGLIEVYIPGGGGGGNGCNQDSYIANPDVTIQGGMGGGGGYNGNSAGDLTITNYQTPTSLWWNSQTLNGAYCMVASAPSGCGGLGYASTNQLTEEASNIPFFDLISPYLTGIDLALLVAAWAAVEASGGIGTDEEIAVQRLAQFTAFLNYVNSYGQSNQGGNGQGPPPTLNALGTPYSSYTLNNYWPIQSGSTNNNVYSSDPQQDVNGGVVNSFSGGDIQNPLHFGYGGSGGSGAGGTDPTGSCGFPGAIIFTLTNSSAGNSI